MIKEFAIQWWGEHRWFIYRLSPWVFATAACFAPVIGVWTLQDGDAEFHVAFLIVLLLYAAIVFLLSVILNKSVVERIRG